MQEEDCPTTTEEKKAIEGLPFLELIGCLWWLAQMTRPDIFVALQQASKWAAKKKPSAKLWRWLKDPEVFGWHPAARIVFKRGHSGPRMQAYFDAAFADTADYKSTAGWIAFVDGAPIAYDSTTIKRVVSSSTEAECNAMAIVAKENTYNRRLFSEIFNAETMPPTSVYGDNSASIMMPDAGVTKRSRHYAIEWFLVRDRVDEGELKVEWVPTETNLADFFTKKLPRAKFTELRNTIMGVDAEPVMVKMMNCDDNPWQGYSRAFEEWLLELNPNAWIGGCPGFDEIAPPVVARVVNAQGPPAQESTQEPETWPEPEIVVPPAQPEPEDCDCKLIYPLLDFSADPVMPKHLKQGSARLTRDSKQMQTFIITYLNTLHAEMAKALDYWSWCATRTTVTSPYRVGG